MALRAEGMITLREVLRAVPPLRWAVRTARRYVRDPARPREPAWAYPHDAQLHVYYASATLQIVVLKGLDQHYRMLSVFRPRHHLFIIIPSIESFWQFGFARECLRSFNPRFPLENVTWLCNTEDAVGMAREHGWRALHVNHNCWLDERIFRLDRPDHRREYDMVMNCRPERWKRPEVAREVRRLAVIRGRLYDPEQEWDLRQLDPVYMNDRLLTPAEVSAVLNRAMCGGIFSAEEGACLASGEYHLCGLPVVSTPSRGGRDVWYDDSNSVICEPTSQAVAAAVEEVREGLRTGRFERGAIREGFLARARLMRDRFNEAVQGIFDRHRLHLDAREHFETAFQSNMVRVVRMRRARQLLRMGARAVAKQALFRQGSSPGK